MTVLTAEDAQLVARLRHGDAAAASELYERHGGALLRFGMAMSNCRQTAEDVVHDTFVELLRYPSRFDPARGPVVAFLFGIARHRMARIARVSFRDAERNADPHDTMDDGGSPDTTTGQSAVGAPAESATALALATSTDDAADALDRVRDIERVRAAVFDLPRVHREVIALCDLEELPYATVATILGCPIGTVRSRLSRARALLATRLALPDESEEDEERRPVAGPPETDAAMDVDAAALTLSVRGSVT
jgi:RNA polymerase sigma-70 factor (ECF subfamily)